MKQTFTALTLIALACALGCAGSKPKPPAPADREYDAAGLMRELAARGDSARRLEAVLEAEISNAAGKLFGSFQVEDGGTDFSLRIQTYTLTGMPVLEAVSIGPRFQIFSPLERRTYFNFTGLADGRSAMEFPLSLFEETTLPMRLLLDQVGLFWGRGLGAPFSYDLAPADGAWILRERDGETLRREIEFTRPELHLTSVRIYQGGSLYGGMSCSAYGSQAPENIVPAKIELYQGEQRLTLALDKVRVNREVQSPPIVFRAPGPGRLILLTPPAAPYTGPVAKPEQPSPAAPPVPITPDAPPSPAGEPEEEQQPPPASDAPVIFDDSSAITPDAPPVIEEGSLSED